MSVAANASQAPCLQVFYWGTKGHCQEDKQYYHSFFLNNEEYRIGDTVCLHPENEATLPYLGLIQECFTAQGEVTEGGPSQAEHCIQVRWFERLTNLDPRCSSSESGAREVVELTETDVNPIGCICSKATVFKACSYEEASKLAKASKCGPTWLWCRGVFHHDKNMLVPYCKEQLTVLPEPKRNSKRGGPAGAASLQEDVADSEDRRNHKRARQQLQQHVQQQHGSFDSSVHRGVMMMGSCSSELQPALAAAAAVGVLPGAAATSSVPLAADMTHSETDAVEKAPPAPASTGTNGGGGRRRGGSHGRSASTQAASAAAGAGAASGRACVECGATQTPQWREGPMGPKTLCNACGVRYGRQQNRAGKRCGGAGVSRSAAQMAGLKAAGGLGRHGKQAGKASAPAFDPVAQAATAAQQQMGRPVRQAAVLAANRTAEFARTGLYPETADAGMVPAPGSPVPLLGLTSVPTITTSALAAAPAAIAAETAAAAAGAAAAAAAVAAGRLVLPQHPSTSAPMQGGGTHASMGGPLSAYDTQQAVKLEAGLLDPAAAVGVAGAAGAAAGGGAAAAGQRSQFQGAGVHLVPAGGSTLGAARPAAASQQLMSRESSHNSADSVQEVAGTCLADVAKCMDLDFTSAGGTRPDCSTPLVPCGLDGSTGTTAGMDDAADPEGSGALLTCSLHGLGFMKPHEAGLLAGLPELASLGHSDPDLTAPSPTLAYAAAGAAGSSAALFPNSTDHAGGTSLFPNSASLLPPSLQLHDASAAGNSSVLPKEELIAGQAATAAGGPSACAGGRGGAGGSRAGSSVDLRQVAARAAAWVPSISKYTGVLGSIQELRQQLPGHVMEGLVRLGEAVDRAASEAAAADAALAAVQQVLVARQEAASRARGDAVSAITRLRAMVSDLVDKNPQLLAGQGPAQAQGPANLPAAAPTENINNSGGSSIAAGASTPVSAAGLMSPTTADMDMTCTGGLLGLEDLDPIGDSALLQPCDVTDVVAGGLGGGLGDGYDSVLGGHSGLHGPHGHPADLDDLAAVMGEDAMGVVGGSWS